jgi:hypothetical protein
MCLVRDHGRPSSQEAEADASQRQAVHMDHVGPASRGVQSTRRRTPQHPIPSIVVGLGKRIRCDDDVVASLGEPFDQRLPESFDAAHGGGERSR